MVIRKAEKKDLEDIMKVYEYARKFMADNGNPNQWINGYPSYELVISDIEKEISFVCVENNEITGVFTFFVGDDPSYNVIRNGKWNSDRTCGVVHRLASDGRNKGVARACFDYCEQKIDYLRIDTHRDNIPMQNAVEKNGFLKCGIINVEDGSERIAYDKNIRSAE